MPLNKLKKIKLPNLKKLASEQFENAKSRLSDAFDAEMNKLSPVDRGSKRLAVNEYPFGIYNAPHIKFVSSKAKVENSSNAVVNFLNDLNHIIILPLPATGIQDELTVNYNVSEIGLVSREIANLFTTAMNNGVADAVTSVTENPALKQKLADRMKINVAQGVEGATGINVLGNLQLETGQAINPAEAVLFDRVGFRQFSLAYKFMPKSKEESDVLEQIIKAFKKNSLPTGNANDSTFLNVPGRWDISFSDDIKGFPQYDACVLTSIQTVYNESKNIFHADGRANEINLVLTFRETSIQTAEKIK